MPFSIDYNAVFHAPFSNVGAITIRLRSSENTERSDQPGKHDGDHADQFDQDINGRTRRILEWVADRIAYNGSFMIVASFAVEMT